MKKILLALVFTFFYLHCKKLSEISKFKKKFDKISIFIEAGHKGVTRSVQNGLKKLDIPFNVNPEKNKDVGDVVFCLDGISLLKRAIQLKKDHKIKKLIVGPNIMGRSHHYDYILSNLAIDHYLAPSLWTQSTLIFDNPAVEKIVRIWPAGVDSDYWKPQHNHKKSTHKVLLYWKTESEIFCNQIKYILNKHGWETIIIKYGNYTLQQYKELLNQVQFAVFISITESQGLALAECWSMNVPTLVWEPKDIFHLPTEFYKYATSCPYLTDQTGKRWKELHELEDLLKNIESYWHEFSPREWVLNNMTDEVSVNLLLKIINE